MTWKTALFAALLFVGLPVPAFAIQTPVLQFDGTEEYQAGGKTWIRYKLSVTNRADFDPVYFTPAPRLPPCGMNPNSARAWIDIHNGRSPYARIYGFCALGSTEDLGKLWFAVEKGKRPPRLVFIKITDRAKNETVSSNRVATY
jgi:hypothetical protein